MKQKEELILGVSECFSPKEFSKEKTVITCDVMSVNVTRHLAIGPMISTKIPKLCVSTRISSRTQNMPIKQACLSSNRELFTELSIATKKSEETIFRDSEFDPTIETNPNSEPN